MSINQRLKILIDTFEGGTVLKFAHKIGAAHTTIAAMLPGNRESKPGYDVIMKVLEAYPTINADWLIKGMGPMVAEKENNENKFQNSGNYLQANPSISVGGLTATATDKGVGLELELMLCKQQNESYKEQIARLENLNERLMKMIESK